ncbi:hypothetical protein RvY_01291 [Ramazzottius varieornatus]|uniref:Uncharacterized protein n=1 Tax=Ramazzottius varieornatus TaxID=947166 RepID=A0A1D1UFS2_RAMVA|nr:hypothetical protein RvY_01291 [Ramazzottius varieornatus]
MDLLDQDFLQPKTLLEIRWVASKQVAIRAIIRDYNGLIFEIGEAVTLAAEGGPLKARLTNLYNFIASTQFLLTLHFLQDLRAELSKLSRKDYRVFGLHDTVKNYNGNSFTAFRKESVDLLQNVLIFFNLRFPETEATRHFRVFQLNKIPRENGRYGDTHIQVLARYLRFHPPNVLAQWTKFKAEFTTKFEPVYWTNENAIFMLNILRERHIVFEDEDSQLGQLFLVASVLPVSTAICETRFLHPECNRNYTSNSTERTKLGRAHADSHKRAAARRYGLPEYHHVMGTVS